MMLEEWDMTLKGMTCEEYVALHLRRARRAGLRAAVEVVGGVFLLILLGLLAWLFLASTPDQASAECEALRAEMEARGE